MARSPQREFSNLVRSLRPSQWIKNLFVFGALIFARRLGDPRSVAAALLAFLVFCALSGAVYLVNDVLDREQDRFHPLKKQRAIASGAVGIRLALSTAALLGLLGFAGGWLLGPRFLAVAAAYLALLIAYSMLLKHIVILDVLTISAGFVLRAEAGGAAIAVPVSQWLLICTSLLALFIALAKRRHELLLFADGSTEHRPILKEYTPYLLDQMISVVTASTLIAYVFYAISPETASRFGTPLLGLTVPFPLYGIFRYLYLIHRREEGGSPAELVLNDKPLLISVALWVAAVILIIYRPFGSRFGPPL